MAGQVFLYTMAGCPFCCSKRRELEARGVAYVEIDISERPERIPELLKLTGGRRIVPVIVEGTEISVAPEGGRDF
jgi:glutaredoxin 3